MTKEAKSSSKSKFLLSDNFTVKIIDRVLEYLQQKTWSNRIMRGETICNQVGLYGIYFIGIMSFIFAICMNSSFFIVELLIDLMSNISLFIRSIGEDLFKESICFSSLITNINTNISVDTSSLNIFSIDGLIKSILSMSLLNLVFTYSLRYILIKVFVLITPFAFLSLILSNTSWFFKAWLKNLFSLLFIQIVVSIILLLMFSVDFSNTDLFSKFIYVGGMYGLIRANSLVREFIGGVSTTVAQSVKSFSIGKP